MQELAANARARLIGLPGLDLVPGQWLHLTTQGVGFTDEVSDNDLTAITSAARTRLTAVKPATTLSLQTVTTRRSPDMRYPPFCTGTVSSPGPP